MELFLIMLAYILGIIIGLYFKIGIALIVLSIILIYFIRGKNRYTKLIYKKKCVILFLIFLTISLFNIIRLEKNYNEKYKNMNSDIGVKGTIISNPISKQNKTTFTLKVESINNDTSFKNTKLRISVKSDKIEYKFGNKISLTGDFEFAENARNTGGFDYREYLKTKGIYGIITTNMNSINLEKEKNLSFVYIFTNKVAIKIKENINNLFNKEEASILNAILIGNKDDMEDKTKETFRKSNLSHILAVSGLHASYVVMFVGFVISKSKISKILGKILTIIFLTFFILLTGKTLSVTRACLMSIYMITASLLHKRVSVYSSINISLLILLIINPYYIFDIGLQLSYGGTIGIVVFYKILKNVLFANKEYDKFENNKNKIAKIIQNCKAKIIEIVAVCLSANITIMPIMIYNYNTISLTFIISNLLASPIIGILIILGFILSFISLFFLPLSKMLAIPLKFLIDIFINIAKFAGNLPLSTIYVPTPKLWLIFFYYIALAVIVSIKKISCKSIKRRYEKRIIDIVKSLKLKKIVSIVLIICIIFTLIKQIPRDLKIYFIDVGQGDSCLIVSPSGKTILIDGGGSSNEKYDVGKNTLIPYLLDRGITKIDFIIISHFDTDHAKGLLSVMEQLKVGKVFISKQGENSENYQRFKEIVKEKRITVQVVNKGDKLKIEQDLYFDILWPNIENLINENILNNNSIVCNLHYKSFSMLFTGDIEEIAERKILEIYKDNLEIMNSAVLKVAHHGSNTSSIQDFLSVVNPKIALIGVGKNNKFGHPNEEVIKRLEKKRDKNI